MPKKVDHHQRRELIAAAVMRVVAHHGLGAASLRTVAAEAGVTGGMVQHYFPNMEAMLDFAMQSARARYGERMEHALAALGDNPEPTAVLEAALIALLPRSKEERADGRVALAFMSHASTKASATRQLREDNEGMRALLADHIRTARGGSAASLADPPDQDASRAAAALMALTDGLGVHILSAELDAEDAVGILRHHIALVLA
ncbi:TetR/AcrR family transcriptional regulator [Nesterenkonia xinjiangensis]|uniref:AcrR family transcriptional regulator n=1 Tax=Nesterenkonia xinjiangensis TaxID=225327 RepID=A0A7Z0K8F0_9MICC|nr:TetR/AcrR family transcriptional regulator [Nesterenkonia xinjiangensis]NYJ77554.1 AcrR family transcriptional regulator [Nesterenkonia xinjiangensis]